MNNASNAPDLPPEIQSRLEEVRRRDLKLRWLNGLVRGLTITLAVMVLAMLVDLFMGWLNPAARWTMTLVTLGTAATSFGLWLLIPLLRRPNAVDIAQTIDARTPDLEERWSTVTELANNQDSEAIRGSESLLQAVQNEARDLKVHVNTETVIPDTPLRLAAKWLAGVAVILLAFVAWDFPQAKILFTRLLLPGSDASLTQIQVLTDETKVPLREAMNLEAAISGKLREDATFVTIRDPRGEETIIPMTLQAETNGHFAHPIKSVSESFAFRIRSGDGQTDWHSVTAVSRPKITEISLQITPPEYSQLPAKELTSLPHRLRLLEGSEVDLRFKADQQLTELRLDFEEHPSIKLTQTDGGWYQFADRPTESRVLKAILKNEHELENKTKPSSRFIVYQDLPPSVRVLDPTDDVAKRPDDTVSIEFEANDDFGIKKADLLVTQVDAEGNEITTEIPIDLDEQLGEQTIKDTVELDLGQFDLKQGDQISYTIAVTDTRESQAQSDSTSNESQAEETEPAESLADSEQAPDTTEPGEAQASDAKPGNQSTPMMAKAQSPKEASEQTPSNNPPPPPNDMAKRMLDVGQCSACKPRNISIDEWAGEFDGDNTEKLQLAIDPVLQQLKSLLQHAKESVATAQNSFSPKDGLTEKETEQITLAKDDLRQSESAIDELIAKSTGTPYAFIGLQLQNIGTSHINPAKEALTAIHRTEPAPIREQLKKGHFHIERALAMLNDLEKTYEEVKRDEKVAAAMQKLAKMHQLFLENSQKLLGSKKPALNTYDRKIAEVDDEFVEQLKELMEEKKKIMDELAKLLAEDPRLLRRYLAMMQLQGTSQRDQMTLLAQRQGEIKTQVSQWHSADEAERKTLGESFQAHYASKLNDTLQASTQMHENMETWLPLEVAPDHPAIQPVTDETKQLIEQLGLTMSEVASGNTGAGLERADAALAHLRSLHEQLPLLGDEISDAPKIHTYVANRLEEVEKLISGHSGWMRIMTALQTNDFSQAAEVVQHTLAQDTATLSDKLVITKDQVSNMSDEIRDTAEDLVRIVQTDIVYPQSVATDYLREPDWDNAKDTETHLVTAFSIAEGRFDDLLNLIIAKLDEAPAPSAAGANKSLDDMLAMLEDELKAAEGLGIPCRPINVSLMTDWMKPGSNPGSSGSAMAQAQAKAAQAQAQQAKQDADRLQKAANAAAKAKQAKMAKAGGGGRSGSNQGPQAPKKSWNVLVSQLEKDILQGRDNVPPEKYRDAINAYFQTIAENIPASQ